MHEHQEADAPHEEHDGVEEHYDDPGDGFGGDDGYDDDDHAQQQQPLDAHPDGSGAPGWLQGML